jgi:CRISPR-associated protein Csb2
LKLVGTTLISEDRGAQCVIAEPDRDSGVWSAYLGGRGHRIWRSVTPVILHGYNTSHGKISVPKTEVLIRAAFAKAGIDSAAISAVFFQAAPLWAGSTAARAFRTPRHLSRYPRYHVEVQFREPVRGPVLAGIGRHYGLGLFAAVSHDSSETAANA